MALPGVHVDLREGPFETVLDRDLVKRFAEATRDPSVLAGSGEAVPPVVMMTQVWEAQLVGRDRVINQAVRAAASGGAHGQHDILLHRPPVPGSHLTTWVDGYGSRPAGRNALCTLHFNTCDEAGDLVAEQWWSFIYVNSPCEVVGEPLPDHSFPDAARDHRVGTYTIELDAGLPQRYAEVTDDWAPVHFDLDAARANGFPGMTAHGLSTLALCSQGIVAQFADGDPSRVERLAGRFSAPALLGHELRVDIFEAAPGVFAFEAEVAGAKVLTHGRLKLRD